MTSLREAIARHVDHEGYWERMDSCNHALDTVTMTDDQRRQLTEVRDDERRGTTTSLNIADMLLAMIRSRLLSEEAVMAGAGGAHDAMCPDGAACGFTLAKSDDKHIAYCRKVASAALTAAIATLEKADG